MRAILLTGAGGWIGRSVAEAAKAAGVHVVGVGRRPAEDSKCDDFIRFDIEGDDLSPIVDRVGKRRLDAVIHCAGLAHVTGKEARNREPFFAVNAKGTRSMLDVARFCEIPRFVYVSTISVYDWQASRVCDEDAAVKGDEPYAGSKLDGEKSVRASGLDWRIARLATVFGPGDDANFSRLAKALARRRFVVPGDGSARKSVLPVSLAGRWLLNLAEIDSPRHRLVNLALPAAPTLHEICEGFSAHCGFPRPFSLPLPILKFAVTLGDYIARNSDGFPLTSRNLRKLTASSVVDVRRAAEMFDVNHPDLKTFSDWLGSFASYYKMVAFRG